MLPTAFIFPGQGAQYPGMGKTFFDAFPLARQTLEEAEELLQSKISSIILNGPTDELTRTSNSQLAIYIVSIALLRVVTDLFPSLQPAVCAGLSLGEFSALTAAGDLSFCDGLLLVQRRSSLMNEACERYPGTMAVVLGLEAAAVEELVKQVNLPNDLWAANFNCPGQVVISGTARGIAAGTAAAKDLGAKRVLPLQVHGAFHSGLMAYAQERLEPYIRQIPLAKGAVPIVMNVSGDYVEGQEAKRDLMIRQVTQPVRWEQGVRAMAARGIEQFIEIGCGSTLTGFGKRIIPNVQSFCIDKVEDLKALEIGIQL